jgi:hypothetical protein
MNPPSCGYFSLLNTHCLSAHASGVMNKKR